MSEPIVKEAELELLNYEDIPTLLKSCCKFPRAPQFRIKINKTLDDGDQFVIFSTRTTPDEPVYSSVPTHNTVVTEQTQGDEVSSVYSFQGLYYIYGGKNVSCDFRILFDLCKFNIWGRYTIVDTFITNQITIYKDPEVQINYESDLVQSFENCNLNISPSLN